jgi:hypothetical protein
MSRSPRPGRACLALALAAAAWAGLTVLTGGFTIGRPASASRRAIPSVRSSSPSCCWWCADAPRRAGVLAPRAARRRHVARGGCRALAAIAALAVLVVAIAWNTRAAGGSDSSCYVLQAKRSRTAASRSSGRSPTCCPMPRRRRSRRPDSCRRRGRHEPVPICGPGLALAMTLPFLVSRGAVFLVVPVCAALWCGSPSCSAGQLDDEVTGASGRGAARVQSDLPVSVGAADEATFPAAALWLGALTAASRAPATAGVLMSLAILTRVNLAPLALLLFIVLPHRRARGCAWGWPRCPGLS